MACSLESYMERMYGLGELFFYINVNIKYQWFPFQGKIEFYWVNELEYWSINIGYGASHANSVLIKYFL